MLGWPPKAQQPCDGDLEHSGIGAKRPVGKPLGVFVPDDAAAWMAVEQPLGGVVGVRFGQAVGVSLGGDLLPVVQIERNLDESCIRDVELLIDFANGAGVLGRRAEGPDGGEMLVEGANPR